MLADGYSETQIAERYGVTDRSIREWKKNPVIIEECRKATLKKIVPAVSHLTFNGEYAARSGIPVRYVTERAVFEMREDGQGGRRLTLTEIAPGIDLQRDVLDQCAAEVAVATDLREMDARIFCRGPMCAGITLV